MPKNSVKTQYMDKAVLGYSEYFFKTNEDRDNVLPVPGDRAIMKNGDLYFCLEKDQWEKISTGGAEYENVDEVKF